MSFLTWMPAFAGMTYERIVFVMPANAGIQVKQAIFIKKHSARDYELLLFSFH